MKKEDLQIIKEGKTGHGLLIENDGYVQLDSVKTLKEGIGDSEWNCPKPFVVDCILQKAGIKNANGRVYPRQILEREVERYQQKIREHRALGECYTPDVLVLCENGWKQMSDVTENDKVLTLNVETNKIEIQKVTKKIEYDFNGDLIQIEGRNISEKVTPNHGYPIYDKCDKFYKFIAANELIDYKSNDDLFIPSNKNNINENKIYLKDIIIENITYNGKVMCIEVPNHTFYVMSNGKCHWSKNCNHPSDSTIDLGRISHNIIEMHWENDTVVGKLELNISEGFRRSGICSTLGDTCANLLLNGYKIGISSRAVGSVENKLGVLMVGDDLELICFDLVSDPSTPGAFLGSKEELQQYLESNEINKNKTIISEKINKLKNILNS